MPDRLEPVDLRGTPVRVPDALNDQIAELVAAELRAGKRSWSTPRLGGDPVAREMLRAHFGGADVVVTGGVRAAAACLAQLVDTAVVERPGFSDIAFMLRAAGVPVRAATWQEMPGLRTSGKRRLWWVTAPVRNPDGALLSPDTAAFLASRAAADDVVVVNETYAPWAKGRQQVPLEGALRVGTVSKMLGGGARFGWIYGESPVPDQVVRSASTGPPGPWQRALARVIGEPLYREHVSSLVARTDAAREAVRRGLAGGGVSVTATAGPNLLVSAHPSFSGDACQAVAAVGLLVGPGPAFDADRSAVRICTLDTTADAAALCRAGTALSGVLGVAKG